MSAHDVIADALKLGSGARFMRCALQVNPHHYRRTFRGDDQDGSAAEYTRAVVDEARAIGVSVLAITDHNSIRDVREFRIAAQGTGVTIMPGFELESTEGIHVLCIYSPDMPEDKLERLLGEFGMRETEPSASQCSENFVGILGRVREQGGIAVAAHATGRKGLFKALQGQARARAWQCPDLLAIQIPGSIPISHLTYARSFTIRIQTIGEAIPLTTSRPWRCSTPRMWLIWRTLLMPRQHAGSRCRRMSPSRVSDRHSLTRARGFVLTVILIPRDTRSCWRSHGRVEGSWMVLPSISIRT